MSSAYNSVNIVKKGEFSKQTYGNRRILCSKMILSFKEEKTHQYSHKRHVFLLSIFENSASRKENKKQESQ